MIFEHRTFWLPKDTRREVEYEDAFFVDEALGRAAVADGVSAGIFSGAWADLLVRAVVADLPDFEDRAALDAWLADLREEWAAGIQADALAWHQKAKLEKGAASTLVAVAVTPDIKKEDLSEGLFRGQVYAVGDSCLFHLRGEQVLQMFPIEESKQFQSDPQVIGSIGPRAKRETQGEPSRESWVVFDAMELECRTGDLLVLCSDAVAAWAMAKMEAEEVPDFAAWWDISQKEWRARIQQLRQEDQIRFDDSTAVLLRIGEQSKQEPSWTDRFQQKLDALAGVLRGGIKTSAQTRKRCG